MSNLDFETKIWESKNRYVCGIDEVGRGCIAGPVYSGAVIFNPESNFQNPYFKSINDSKKISEKKRESLVPYIKKISLSYSTGYCTSDEVDSIGIQEAVKLSMIRAIENLKITPDFLLIDSMKIESKIPQINIIKGDETSKTISAASIIAKVERDNLMKVKIAHKYKNYNFQKNKGYGTKEHLEAIKKFGITEIHRKTFEPIKSMIVN